MLKHNHNSGRRPRLSEVKTVEVQKQETNRSRKEKTKETRIVERRNKSKR
jgi:hypothetical protein